MTALKLPHFDANIDGGKSSSENIACRNPFSLENAMMRFSATPSFFEHTVVERYRRM
jgi:hypothetical protein